MSKVTLDLVSLDDTPLADASGVFEGAGGTIGRGEENTLVLPDAQRRVSRLHATISFPGGVPTITNSSKVLTVGVGSAELASGQSTPLLPRMSLHIGPYVLMVRPWAEPADATACLPVHSERSGLAVAPGSPQADPGAELHASLIPAPPASGVGPPAEPVGPTDDPLAALLGSSGASPAAPHQLARNAGHDPFAVLGIASPVAPRYDAPVASPPLRAALPSEVIPEDFNPFDLPSAAARNAADPLAAMLGGSNAPAHALAPADESIDALLGPADAAAVDQAFGVRASGPGLFRAPGAEPSPLLTPPEQSDPLALFGAPARGTDEQASPMRDDLPELGGAYRPPRALDPLAAFAPAASAPANLFQNDPMQPAASLPAADELTQAFLKGANLPAGALPNGLTPEVMATIGSLVRSATAGAIDLLAVRASVKREVQARVTIISNQGNNPLKFLVDAGSVLQHLLGRKMPGFMSADEAMKDAFDDLRAHEMGVIAGTRAALNEVLGKFDPALLGERLVQGSLLEKALPAIRKTKLWDLYLERYAQLRSEVEDDFQKVFGDAFVAAYENEIARMKARGKDSR